MTGIILAAGDGTRLKKTSGTDNCKPLTKINGVYLIEFALENLIAINVTEAVIVVGKDGELIKSILGVNYKSLKITYVYQPEQKGLINAIAQTLNFVNHEDVVLQLSDEMFSGFKSENIKNIIENQKFNQKFDFYCGVTYEKNVNKIKSNYSVDTDENNVIKNCTEKPEHIINNLKGTGFCIFNRCVLSLLKEIYDEETNTPYDLCDFLNFLISQNKKGVAFCVADIEFNINTAVDLTEATDFYLIGRN